MKEDTLTTFQQKLATEKFVKSIADEFQFTIYEGLRYGHKEEEILNNLKTRLTERVDHFIDQAGIKDITVDFKKLNILREFMTSLKAEGKNVDQETEENKIIFSSFKAVFEYDNAIGKFTKEIEEHGRTCIKALNEKHAKTQNKFKEGSDAISMVAMNLIKSAIAVGIAVFALGVSGLHLNNSEILINVGLAVLASTAAMSGFDLVKKMTDPNAFTKVMQKNLEITNNIAKTLKEELSKPVTIEAARG
jgi:hypothetical protein